MKRTNRESINHVSGSVEWSQRLSKELPDWYSPNSSAAFTKTLFALKAKVFIESTELGDVLATSGLPFAQGIEVPKESSTSYENCGQAQTLTFYLELLPQRPSLPGLADVPYGGDEGYVFPNETAWAIKPYPTKGIMYSHGHWRQAFSWRRAHCAGANRSLFAVNPGDISQQNSGNDLDSAYLFPERKAVSAEI
eukprot:SAG31_NODE_17665_length_662_cov_1.000000_1_plen_193_part_10